MKLLEKAALLKEAAAIGGGLTARAFCARGRRESYRRLRRGHGLNAPG
jgi:hypothetical protein